MPLQLRSPDDVKRLFSALGDQLSSGDTALTLSDVDALALSGTTLGEGEGTSFALSLLVALSIGWVAIRGYERNNRSIPWGLAWGAFGYLLPIPAVAASYYQDVRPAA
jgi:hypothetical protein